MLPHFVAALCSELNKKNAGFSFLRNIRIKKIKKVSKIIWLPSPDAFGYKVQALRVFKKISTLIFINNCHLKKY